MQLFKNSFLIFLILGIIILGISVTINCAEKQLYYQIQEAFNCTSISNNICCASECGYLCGSCTDQKQHNDACCAYQIIETNRICGHKVSAPCIINYEVVRKIVEGEGQEKGDDDKKSHHSDKKSHHNDKKSHHNDKKKSKSKNDDDSSEDASGEKDSGFEIIGDWFEDQHIAVIIVISILAGLLLILIIYSCAFFGTKHPPIDYDKIIGKW